MDDVEPNICRWQACHKERLGKSAFCKDHQKELSKGPRRVPRMGQPYPGLDQYELDEGNR